MMGTDVVPEIFVSFDHLIRLMALDYFIK